MRKSGKLCGAEMYSVCCHCGKCDEEGGTFNRCSRCRVACYVHTRTHARKVHAMHTHISIHEITRITCTHTYTLQYSHTVWEGVSEEGVEGWS
jgi:hypothetical protein